MNDEWSIERGRTALLVPIVVSADLRKALITPVGFDRNRTFMLVEIAVGQMCFQTTTCGSATIDNGVIRRREVWPSVSELRSQSAPASTQPAGCR